MNKLISRYSDYILEAGCDEAGRGCLAGPVVAAAVMFDDSTMIAGLNDSKKLSPKKRLLLRDEIIEKALDYAIAFVDNKEIDKINILNASILAMQNALAKLGITPDFIIVDGNRFKQFRTIPHQCIVGGDNKFMNIAAASILAKTSRDEYMKLLHHEYPQYNWSQNKGYPTLQHRSAVFEFGLSPYHRKTFSIRTQMKMF